MIWGVGRGGERENWEEGRRGGGGRKLMYKQEQDYSQWAGHLGCPET